MNWVYILLQLLKLWCFGTYVILHGQSTTGSCIFSSLCGLHQCSAVVSASGANNVPQMAQWLPDWMHCSRGWILTAFLKTFYSTLVEEYVLYKYFAFTLLIRAFVHKEAWEIPASILGLHLVHHSDSCQQLLVCNDCNERHAAVAHFG